MGAFADQLGKMIYGMIPSEAIEQGICISCAEKAEFGVNIYSDAGMKEYQISGLCEVCFDNIANGS